MPAGRTSEYTPEIGEKICARIRSGESVRQITADEDMPCEKTVYNWLAANSEFLQQYVRAREAQADYFAEEILEIADDGTNDWMERRDSDGAVMGWRENGEAMQRSKLRVDTRKWLMSKMAPKKYGDRSTVDLNHNYNELSTEELEARLAKLEAGNN